MTATAPDTELGGGELVPGRRFIPTVAAAMALAALSIDLVLPAFADVREEYGLAADSSEPSRLVTTFFIGLALGQLVYGPVSDRYGRKPLLYAGLVLYAGAAVAAALMPTFGGLLVCRFFWGFGAAAPRSLALAMVRDAHHGERMARVMSHVMAIFILVPIVAPAIGTAAIAVGPWRAVLWLPAVAAAAVGLLVARLPETLPPSRRRSISPAALLEAFRAVVGTTQTLVFAVAITFLFGMMTAFIGSVEIIVDDVFGRRSLFPVVFAIVGCTLGAGSLLSGWLVVRIGLSRLLRRGAYYLVAVTAGLATLAVATDGHPPMWAFVVAVALVLPGAAMLVPNCNTAAMAPLSHVAGMAAALLGTISTGLGALIGSIVDGAFDGSVRPYALASLACAVVASGGILSVANRVPAPTTLEWMADEPAATT